MPSSTFDVGTAVMAKWPGSNLWFKSTILDVTEDGYSVRYEDGTEEDIPKKDVMAESYFTRSRSRSRSRSPGRRRSRSPARKSSPSRSQRKSRSPARKPAEEKKAVVDTPVSRAQEKRTETKLITRVVRSLPMPFLSPSKGVKKTVTKTEHHTYTTRAQTRSGKQILEPLVEMKSGRVPKTTHYEFGGPIGTFLMIFGLPFVVYYLYFTCLPSACQLTHKPPFSLNWKDYYDQDAYLLYLGWFLFQAILALIPIGKVVQGQPLRSGRRLSYRTNGLFALVVTFASFGAMVYYKCGVEFIVDKFLPLMTAAVLFSFLFSLVLYIKARRAPNTALAPGGNSGNVIYDFFIGHELNPRVGSLDLKYFCELRPGLFLWALINFACLAKVWTDFPDNAPWNLILICIFQFVYVFDALLYESAILTTMDIIQDGFGFMLVFGDLAWVPFTYSLQARYLVDHAPGFDQRCLIPVAMLFSLGYCIFRMANSQKNSFRENPHGKTVSHLVTIPTDTGRRLLISGWWGFVRKPNYLGDLLMALSWSLCTGFGSVVPYFYPIYFFILLVHRERRDDAACRQKYGGAWDKYCSTVKYRIIPYIY
ncbi:delta(14)-sterol reductase TM7SF2-like [Diadema antillarum]|uniref:delta(14)-sterol reductase TM7SF2-like n=1 Tax=Diadema antillarum TaxID=105358 RepID=UPI003A8C7E32